MADKIPQPARLSPLLLIGILAVAALLVIPAVRALTRETVEVRVSPVTHENLVSQVSTNGKVEPTLMFQAHAPIAGVIEQVYVEVGQKVKQGDLLLRMDDSDAAARVASANAALHAAQVSEFDLQQNGTQSERTAYQAELVRAQQQEKAAEQNLNTLQQLQSKGAASAAEVNSARTRVTEDQAALLTAQKNVSDRFNTGDRSRAASVVSEAQANVAAARNAYTKYVVRAPFNGTVFSVPVSDYDFVPGGEDLLDMADLRHIHVRAYFDEPEIGKLAVGQPVRIVWDARPNRAWHGHVEVAPTTVITYGTRNVGECLITVDDADGDLLPNTNVTVTVTYSQRFNVLTVPREALHTEGSTNYVYRVVNHHLQRTVVQVDAINLTRVQITSGLTEKDTVALNATSNRDLTNGLEVRAVE